MIHLKVRLYCLCRNEEIKSVFDVNGFWSPLCIQRRNECRFFVHTYMHVYRSIYAGNSGKGFGRQLIRFHGSFKTRMEMPFKKSPQKQKNWAGW